MCDCSHTPKHWQLCNNHVFDIYISEQVAAVQVIDRKPSDRSCAGWLTTDAWETATEQKAFLQLYKRRILKRWKILSCTKQYVTIVESQLEPFISLMSKPLLGVLAHPHTLSTLAFTVHLKYCKIYASPARGDYPECNHCAAPPPGHTAPQAQEFHWRGVPSWGFQHLFLWA